MQNATQPAPNHQHALAAELPAGSRGVILDIIETILDNPTIKNANPWQDKDSLQILGTPGYWSAR
jgi:hypothetical protein